jgi:ubiquinone biosynthesis protein
MGLYLLPRRWQRYREISRVFLRHGFGFLLESAGLRRLRWPPRRAVPSPPPAHHLRLALEELGPTFIKLGQVLSTRPDLIPPPFVAELARLQDRVPPFPAAEARHIIEEELGAPVEELFADFQEEPLAAASLSQVHGARLRTGEEVVLKVQRPGIEAQVATDLEILRRIARLAEERLPQAELYDLPGIVEEFGHTLHAEMDFRREANNAERFRHNFTGKPYLYIPRVYWEFTTHRVLTLERVYGLKIDDIPGLEAAGIDRHRVALHATDVVMQEIFQDGFFHADPHPGNFFVLPGDIIAAVDFGMVGYLSRSLREQLVSLLAAAVQMDTTALVQQLLRMSLVETGVDREGLRRDLERLLQAYAGRPLKELRAAAVLEEAMPIAFRRRLRLPAELWLLGKMLAMLEGVGTRLDPDFDPFAVARPYALRLLRESTSLSALTERFRSALLDWGELLLDFPLHTPTLFTRLQRGDWTVGVELRRTEGPLAVLDTLSLRLSLGILIAVGLVVAALFLRLLLVPGTWWSWLIVGAGGAALAGLLAAFVWTLRRTG